MFREDELKAFEKLAREKADDEIKKSFHPQDRDSMQAKLLWDRVYRSELQSRVYGRGW